jgi:hypothetical protein
VKSEIQLVSQLEPPSVENACSQRAESAVMPLQRNRQRIGVPSHSSSENSSPSPSVKPPRAGIGSSVPVRPSTQ